MLQDLALQARESEAANFAKSARFHSPVVAAGQNIEALNNGQKSQISALNIGAFTRVFDRQPAQIPSEFDQSSSVWRSSSPEHSEFG